MTTLKTGEFTDLYSERMVTWVTVIKHQILDADYTTGEERQCCPEE